jgi:hypothetical protein
MNQTKGLFYDLPTATQDDVAGCESGSQRLDGHSLIDVTVVSPPGQIAVFLKAEKPGQQ